LLRETSGLAVTLLGHLVGATLFGLAIPRHGRVLSLSVWITLAGYSAAEGGPFREWGVLFGLVPGLVTLCGAVIGSELRRYLVRASGELPK
jgi:hypothetical protein